MMTTMMIGRLSYDLEKVFAVCFTGQCLARLKQHSSLFPPRKLLIWVVNNSIAQSHYCISNDVKAKLSRKFHGEMTLFASAFAKPMKIRARLLVFCSISQLNVSHFCLRSVFTLISQGHVKVVLMKITMMMMMMMSTSIDEGILRKPPDWLVIIDQWLRDYGHETKTTFTAWHESLK